MPKMKTKKSAAKRFKKTATGKIKRGTAYRRHIMGHKSVKAKRHLRAPMLVNKADVKNVAILIPYA